MRYLILFLLSSSLFFTACNTLLEEDIYSFSEPSDIEDSDAGADLWVNGVYRYVYYAWWDTIPLMREQDCDYGTGPTWSYGNLGTGNFQGDPNLFLLWEAPYKVISMSNNAISAINVMKNVSIRKRDIALGELDFLKAWSYFSLVRDFGKVPLYRPDDNLLIHHGRSDIPTVYAHIIELLKSAEGSLPKNTEKEYQAGHIPAGAAASLLAKVYLTMASCAKADVIITVNGGPAIDNTVTGTPNWHKYTRPGIPVQCKKNAAVAGYETLDPKTYFTLARDKAKEVIDGLHGTYKLFEEWRDIWKIENENKQENIWSYQSSNTNGTFASSIPAKFSGQWSAPVTYDNGAVSGGFLVNGMIGGMTYHWYELFEDDVDTRVVHGVVHSYQIGNVTTGTTAGGFYPVNQKWQERARNKQAPWFTLKGVDTYKLEEARVVLPLTKHMARKGITSYNSDMIYPLIRLAEVYLIYAEAKNEVDGPTTGAPASALDYLNKVRTRSKATPYAYMTGSTKIIQSPEDFRNVIIEERARELAMENGERRYDLLRWGLYLPAMNSFRGVDEGGLSKERVDKHLLYPIPSAEIAANDSLKVNNPGWK